jgi:hypothetical protein
MSDDGHTDNKDGSKGEDDIRRRFPNLPSTPDVPEVPGLDSVAEPVKEVTIGSAPEVPQLAPVNRPVKPKASGPAIAPGSYNKAALASTAATSFIMPTILFSLLGYWLDKRMHTNYWAFIGVVFGLIVGISALMRIIKRLE